MRIRSNARELIPFAAFIGSIVLMTTGAGLIWLPLAFLLPGTILFGLIVVKHWMTATPLPETDNDRLEQFVGGPASEPPRESELDRIKDQLHRESGGW
jgi:hypothetical protein